MKGKYAFAPLPSIPMGMTARPAGAPAAQSIVSGDNVAIASYSKNKDLALAYVNIITNNDMQAEQFADFGNLPDQQGSIRRPHRQESDACSVRDRREGLNPNGIHRSLVRHPERRHQYGRAVAALTGEGQL